MNGSDLWLPEGRLGQSLALSVTVILAAMISLGIVAPAFHCYHERAAKLAYRQREVSHIAGMERLIPQLRKQLAGQGAKSGSRQMLLQGASDAIDGAQLQSLIESLSRQSTAGLTSTVILPGRNVRALRQIAISVNLTATWNVLIALLRSIDLAHPRMIVSDLAITDSGQATDITQNIPLQISFTIAAFRARKAP